MRKQSDEEPKEQAIVPKVGGQRDSRNNAWKPEEYDPEMANIALARHLVDGAGTIGHVDKPFIIRQALAEALNHVPPKYKQVKVEGIEGDEDMFEQYRLEMTHPGNPTGYDTSLRVAVYGKVMRNSVHVNGMMFNNIWALMMKPKYIINGMSGNLGQFEEDKGESIIGRLINFMRGGKPQENGGNKQ